MPRRNIRRRMRVTRAQRTPLELQQAAKAKREKNAQLFGLYAAGPDGKVRFGEVTATPAVIMIRLPHRTPSLNDLIGYDKSRKARIRTAWHYRLTYAIDLANPRRAAAPPHLFPTLASRLDWVTPTNRPAVFIARQVPSSRNFLDRDNAWGGCKPVLDALVAEGFLPNDRERDIDQHVEQGVSADGLDYTVITIDARAPELRTRPEARA